MLDKAKPASGWQIKAAACLAAGSMKFGNSAHVEGRSLFQIACFLDVVEHVQQSSDHRILMFGEELKYTDRDIALLASKNVIASKGPDFKAYDPQDSEAAMPWPWTVFGEDLMLFEFGLPIIGAEIPRLLSPSTR